MKKFSSEEISRIVEIAWEDYTPFEAIIIQFGLRENGLRKIMRSEMKPSSYEMWRKKMRGRKTKHLSLRQKNVKRFKSENH